MVEMEYGFRRLCGIFVLVCMQLKKENSAGMLLFNQRRLVTFKIYLVQVIFIKPGLFNHGKESAFLHVLSTMYRHNNRFIGNRVVIQLMRTFRAFKNKSIFL